MFRNYVQRLAFRTCIFAAAACAYFLKPGLIEDFFGYKLSAVMIPVYVAWGTMMLDMAHQFFPNSLNTIGSQKQHSQFYTPVQEGYDKAALAAYIKRSDKTALYVFILWLAVFTAVALLFALGLFGTEELVLTSLLFYICDLVCVVFWCPFQSIFMKNRCCATCRIYNWDWFMICSPLILIKSFFSWSLVAVSVLVLIKWERTWRKHPERFWDGANASLQCGNCAEKMCRIKNRLKQKEETENNEKNFCDIGSASEL